jgi:hypothetical protein
LSMIRTLRYFNFCGRPLRQSTQPVHRLVKESPAAQINAKAENLPFMHAPANNSESQTDCTRSLTKIVWKSFSSYYSAWQSGVESENDSK